MQCRWSCQMHAIPLQNTTTMTQTAKYSVCDQAPHRHNGTTNSKRKEEKYDPNAEIDRVDLKLIASFNERFRFMGFAGESVADSQSAHNAECPTAAMNGGSMNHVFQSRCAAAWRHNGHRHRCCCQSSQCAAGRHGRRGHVVAARLSTIYVHSVCCCHITSTIITRKKRETSHTLINVLVLWQQHTDVHIWCLNVQHRRKDDMQDNMTDHCRNQKITLWQSRSLGKGPEG